MSEARDPLYVIGHRNPDTDAVCSALGYADFLRQTGTPEAEAAMCGPVNQRTAFVLEQANIDAPRMLLDVRPTAAQLMPPVLYRAMIGEPFVEVYRRMQEYRVRSIPVVDHKQKLVGVLSLLKLMEMLLPDKRDMMAQRDVRVSLRSVRNVLGGTFQFEQDGESEESLHMMVGAMSANGFQKRLHQLPAEKVLLLVGDRPTIQAPAIEYGVRLLVVTGGYTVSDDLLALAKANEVSVLVSPYDTAMTAQLIKSARSINDAVEEVGATLTESMRVPEIQNLMGRLDRQNLFPVVNEDGCLTGVLSRSDLVNPKRSRLILVDHNEFSQAVTGADEADILEVIDHHRIGGGLTSREPMRFLNDIVGSTSTMIGRMYRQHSVLPPASTAICLSAGIISDTLNLRSPTTTNDDREVLEWLRGYTGLDMEQFSTDLFASGSTLKNKPVALALTTDCKTYEENGWKVTVSQLEELGLGTFREKREELEQGLSDHVDREGLDFAGVMITDITTENSLFLVSGSDQIIDRLDYPQMEKNLFEMNGVVSRKKQLLPALMYVLTHATKKG